MTAALVAAILVYLTPVNALEVSARSAVVLDGDSGAVLWEKNAGEKSLIASTTKIMTALVTLERTDPDEVVTVPQEAAGIEGSSVYLRAGETLTVRDLLYGMMLQSGNDAATALAVYVSGSEDAFAAEMNRKAQELGLKEIHFANPHGLDSEENYATAYSLGKLAAAAMKNPVSNGTDLVRAADYTVFRILQNAKHELRCRFMIRNLLNDLGLPVPCAVLKAAAFDTDTFNKALGQFLFAFHIDELILER